MAAPIKFGVGQSVLRKEDDALIRGKGRYTDDHAPSPAMHALVLRSPHAHAKFTMNVTKARGMPGVGAVLTADDVKDRSPRRSRHYRTSCCCWYWSPCSARP